MNDPRSSPSSTRTDTKKLSVSEKKEILADFWEDRYSAILNYSNLATGSDTGRQERWVDKKLTYSTNRGMLYVFIAIIVGFYILHIAIHSGSSVEASASHNLLHISLFIGTATLLLLLMRGAKRIAYSVFAHRLSRAGRSEFEDILSRPEYESVIADKVVPAVSESQTKHEEWRWLRTRRFFLRRWIDLNFFVPFSYRFIWWWTLVAGVATAEIDYFTQTPGFGLSFMRAVIVSVIAYIATNIIRELLALREHYKEGVESAKESSEKTDQLRARLSEDVPRLLAVSRTAIGSNEMANSVKKLLEGAEKEKDPALLEQSAVFVSNLATIVDNFVAQVEEGTPLVKQCVLLTLNHYLMTQNDILKPSEKRVITRFSTLAEIGKDLVKSLYPADGRVSVPVEFYGLMVIPPEKFLNYENKQAIGDVKWEGYLGSLVESATRQVPIKKYFLSLRAKAVEDLVEPETSDLFYVQVRNELNKGVRVDKNNIPFHEPSATGRKYFIDAEWPDSEQRRPLRDVLDDVYHAPRHCFIREFSQEQYNEHLWDSRKKLPLDYFAIRKDGNWEFCLQTYYHKALDAADIEVFYAGMSDGEMNQKWTRVKESLDHIFFPEQQEGVFSIKEYNPT